MQYVQDLFEHPSYTKVFNKYWKTLQGTFDKGRYDMHPVSAVNAPKRGQTNNLTLFGDAFSPDALSNSARGLTCT